MIKDGCQAAQAFQKDSFYLLDRYFPTFKELNTQNAANSRKVDMVSRMKLSTVAYRTPLPRQSGRRGRKPVKGEKVKLAGLFETEKAFFRTGKINLYGRKQSVQYYAVDLLWGQGLYQKLRFVLVECGTSRVILVSTNLNLHPAAIIRLYGYRFRRKDAPDPLSAIVAVSERAHFENSPGYGDVRAHVFRRYGRFTDAFR